MIYTRQNIIDNLVSIQNDSDFIPKIITNRHAIIERIRQKDMAKKTYLESLNDSELIREYREVQELNLKILAPGKFILTNDIQNFICQNL